MLVYASLTELPSGPPAEETDQTVVEQTTSEKSVLPPGDISV